MTVIDPASVGRTTASARPSKVVQALSVNGSSTAGLALPSPWRTPGSLDHDLDAPVGVHMHDLRVVDQHEVDEGEVGEAGGELPSIGLGLQPHVPGSAAEGRSRPVTSPPVHATASSSPGS